MRAGPLEKGTRERLDKRADSTEAAKSGEVSQNGRLVGLGSRNRDLET